MILRRITSAHISQRPEFIRKFIDEFMVDPDVAIARIIDLQSPKGYVALGRLFVQLPELNRSRLGEYLGRKGSRPGIESLLGCLRLRGHGYQRRSSHLLTLITHSFRA